MDIGLRGLSIVQLVTYNTRLVFTADASKIFGTILFDPNGKAYIDGQDSGDWVLDADGGVG